MKKKNSYFLLDSLINTDFILLKKHFFLKNLNLYNLLQINQKKYFHILNPLDILKTLKQFLKVIEQIKKKKSILNFFIDDDHQKSIIINFFKKNNIFLPLQFYSKFLNLNKKVKFQPLFFFKETIYESKKLTSLLLTKHIFITQKINSVLLKDNLDFYTIYNKLTDYKKLIFILTFFGHILKKTNTSLKTSKKNISFKPGIGIPTNK
jgi:hypothetical protein